MYQNSTSNKVAGSSLMDIAHKMYDKLSRDPAAVAFNLCYSRNEKPAFSAEHRHHAPTKERFVDAFISQMRVAIDYRLSRGHFKKPTFDGVCIFPEGAHQYFVVSSRFGDSKLPFSGFEYNRNLFLSTLGLIGVETVNRIFPYKHKKTIKKRFPKINGKLEAMIQHADEAKETVKKIKKEPFYLTVRSVMSLPL